MLIAAALLLFYSLLISFAAKQIMMWRGQPIRRSAFVRLQWCEVSAVKVRVGHALSGPKTTVTASPQGGVGSNRSQTVGP